MVLAFDIETVPSETPPPAPKAGETDPFPPPPCHQVVCIGIAVFDDACLCQKIALAHGERESAILRSFIAGVSKMDPTLVSWNGRGFDLPVVVARSMRFGIPFPWYYRTRGARYRFSDEGHLDVKDVLADYGAARPCTLDATAKLIGLPGKIDGIDGSQVAQRIAAGELAAVQAYCLQDVVQTSAVWLRYELVCGRLDPDEYREAMSSLVAVAHADERTRPVVEAADRRILMLGAESPAEAAQ